MNKPLSSCPFGHSALRQKAPFVNHQPWMSPQSWSTTLNEMGLWQHQSQSSSESRHNIFCNFEVTKGFPTECPMQNPCPKRCQGFCQVFPCRWQSSQHMVMLRSEASGTWRGQRGFKQPWQLWLLWTGWGRRQGTWLKFGPPTRFLGVVFWVLYFLATCWHLIIYFVDVSK